MEDATNNVENLIVWLKEKEERMETLNHDPEPTPKSELDDPEDNDESKDGPKDIKEYDMMMGENHSGGPETDIVVESNDEADDEKAKQQVVDNSAHVNNTPTKSSVVTNHPVDDKTSLVDIRAQADRNEELKPYERLCAGTRCQRPYTWYTTRVAYSNTRKPVIIDQNMEESPVRDLTRDGSNVRKKLIKSKIHHDLKKCPKHSKPEPQRPKLSSKHRRPTAKTRKKPKPKNTK